MARAYAIDIQNQTQVDEAVKEMVSDLGDIEVLVNNVSLDNAIILDSFEAALLTQPSRLALHSVHRPGSGNCPST